jgi:hypothetical protein
MKNEIEIIRASDPQVLKPQLEQMVNRGWKIKGVIGYNPHNINSEPFVILERDSADNPEINESLYVNEVSLNEQYITNPEPPKKEISISMG